MKRKIVACLIVFIFLICCTPLAMAHDDQAEHDGDLKYALFGDRDKILDGNERIAFRAIANAAALSIDQFSPNTESKWKYNSTYETLKNDLSALGLPQIPIDFDSIDLNANVNNGVNITANTHRSFTHQGWNYSHYPNPKIWDTRKSFLVDVVNRVLFFPKKPLIKIPWIADFVYGSTEQCEAFAALVYYIHILGDHIEGDDPAKLTDLEPLIQYTSASTPGIISELQEQLQIVFASQKNSRTFISLQQELTDLRIKTEQNCGMWGSIDTFEKCETNQIYAQKLLNILGEYLPVLLQNEDFFVNRFAKQPNMSNPQDS